MRWMGQVCWRVGAVVVLVALAAVAVAAGGKAGKTGKTDTEKRLEAGEEAIAALEELNRTLAGATDEATAKEAAPRVREILARLDVLSERMGAIPESPEESDESIPRVKALRDRTRRVMEGMIEQSGRLNRSPELKKHLEEPLRWVPPKPAASQPTSLPASQPASKPASRSAD